MQSELDACQNANKELEERLENSEEETRSWMGRTEKQKAKVNRPGGQTKLTANPTSAPTAFVFECPDGRACGSGQIETQAAVEPPLAGGEVRYGPIQESRWRGLWTYDMGRSVSLRI